MRWGWRFNEMGIHEKNELRGSHSFRILVHILDPYYFIDCRGGYKGVKFLRKDEKKYSTVKEREVNRKENQYQTIRGDKY